MTDELKPVRCGCGGEAKIRQDGTLYYVRCPECGTESADYQFSVEAIEVWNRAMGERTAKVVEGQKGSWYCTGCGKWCDKDEDIYCAYCGARLEWE